MTVIFRQVDHDKFIAVCDGTKSVETRAATSKYLKLKPGDTLTFKCGNRKCTKIIKAVHHFRAIEDIDLDPRKILPGARTINDLNKMYASFPGYADKIAKFGLVAWELE